MEGVCACNFKSNSREKIVSIDFTEDGGGGKETLTGKSGLVMAGVKFTFDNSLGRSKMVASVVIRLVSAVFLTTSGFTGAFSNTITGFMVCLFEEVAMDAVGPSNWITFTSTSFESIVSCRVFPLKDQGRF